MSGRTTKATLRTPGLAWSNEVVGVRTDEPAPASGGPDTITTLEELGTYLRGLRDSKRVTQEGLTAHTGRKIARSRISEIENARRDPLTERELRAYLMGLKCTPRDIEQLVIVLTRCTTTVLAGQTQSHQDTNCHAATEVYPTGLADVENNPAPPEQTTEDYPAAATGRYRTKWKVAAAAISSVIVVIVGIALFYVNARNQNHGQQALRADRGHGAAAATLNPSRSPTQSTPSPGVGVGATALNPAPTPSQSTPGPGVGAGALNPSPLPIQPNAAAGTGQNVLPSRPQPHTGDQNSLPPPAAPNTEVQRPPPTPASTQDQTPVNFPIPGDDTLFIADVTYPDNSSVRVNEQFVKTWEIQNSGSVFWQGRYLTRQTTQDAGNCSSPPRASIPGTPPGQRVEISVTFTAPSTPASCRVDWKMTNSNGQLFFPNKNPIYLLVNVIQ